MVNELFLTGLQKFVVKPELAPLFSEVIIDTYNQQHKSVESHSGLLKEIDELNARVRKARELLLSGDIDGSDFKIIKSETEAEIEKLEIKLSEALLAKKSYINIEPIARTAVDLNWFDVPRKVHF
jgi:site-specific DNA recombinase